MPHDDSSTTPIEIDAPAGTIIGARAAGVDRFLGLRYAEPPTGPRRFRPPVRRAAATEPISATEPGNRCHQVGLGIDQLFAGIEATGEESEDCLVLNVFTPSTSGDPRPVIVWIHGGAFINGSANDYDPSALVSRHDVIVVTINYRLGIFGFLDLSAVGEYAGGANLGIQDQIAALGWVQENIASFGGDPDRVAVWGESAGASSVLALLGAPAAAGLFHRAAAFSGAETLAPPADQLPLLGAALGTDDPRRTVEALRDLSSEQLSQLQVDSGFYAGTSLDGTVITRPACEAIVDGGAADIPIITGATRDEGTFLAPAYAFDDNVVQAMLFGLAASTGRDDGAAYRAHLDATIGLDEPVACLTQAWFDLFRSSALRVAATASLHGAGGWVYDFEVETDHELGVTHGADLPFTFDWLSLGSSMSFTHPATAENQDLAVRWSTTLIDFVTTGAPGRLGELEWPRYEPDAYRSLRLRHHPDVAERADEAMFDIYRVPHV